jgi:hypothetical protein
MAVSALVTRYDAECVDPNERMGYHLTNIPKDGAKVKFSHRKL